MMKVPSGRKRVMLPFRIAAPPPKSSRSVFPTVWPSDDSPWKLTLPLAETVPSIVIGWTGSGGVESPVNRRLTWLVISVRTGSGGLIPACMKPDQTPRMSCGAEFAADPFDSRKVMQTAMQRPAPIRMYLLRLLFFFISFFSLIIALPVRFGWAYAPAQSFQPGVFQSLQLPGLRPP